MAKKKGSKQESKRYREFEQENDKLKREVSKLRKQVKNKLVSGLEQNLNQIDDEQQSKLSICTNCGNPGIHIIDIKRKDGHFEMKVCELCKHRTEMKKKKKR